MAISGNEKLEPQVQIVIAEESLYESRVDLVKLRARYPNAQVAPLAQITAFNQAHIAVVPFSTGARASYDLIWSHNELAQIIILDRNLSVQKTAEAMKHGVVDVVNKPLSTERLIHSIERALRLSQSPGLKQHRYLWNVFKAMEKMNHTHDEGRLLHLFCSTLIQETMSKGAIVLRCSKSAPADELKPFLSIPGKRSAPPLARSECERLGKHVLKHQTKEQPLDLRKPRYGRFDEPLTLMDVGVVRDLLVIPIEYENDILVCCFLAPPENLHRRIDLEILGSFGQHTGAALKAAKQYKEISDLVYIDDVTGLYNARYLPLALDNKRETFERDGSTFAVLFIDLDRFKSINDKHGHLVGSDILIQAGHVIRRSVRYDDAVFRYGGDEFVVILASTDPTGAMGAAERVRRNLESHEFSSHGVTLHLTASIGVSCYPTDGLNVQTILELADKAMYEGKRRSRNIVLMIDSKAS